MSDLNFNNYARTPFVVEAVEITDENIEEIAKYVGELKAKDDGSPYILVDKKLVPNIYRVFPGFFLTRMGDNFRCYSSRVFREQFVLVDTTIQQGIDLFFGEVKAWPPSS